jgi:rubrerythrin
MFRTIDTPKERKENINKLHDALRSGEMPHEEFLKKMSAEVGPMSEPTWAKANVSQKRASTFLSEGLRRLTNNAIRTLQEHLFGK